MGVQTRAWPPVQTLPACKKSPASSLCSANWKLARMSSR